MIVSIRPDVAAECTFCRRVLITPAMSSAALGGNPSGAVRDLNRRAAVSGQLPFKPFTKIPVIMIPAASKRADHDTYLMITRRGRRAEVEERGQEVRGV